MVVIVASVNHCHTHIFYHSFWFPNYLFEDLKISPGHFEFQDGKSEGGIKF